MCHFCQQSSPVLEKAIAENKNVRTFFKDFTIFADRTLTAHLSPGWGQKLVSTSLISTGRKNTTSSIISS
ncbi:hypothetical protein [Klebsiella quasipneumoniae]|uniref:hypothetical protein n=1 Tax=Klebsiella quasipneumoniae TaxID=1463165 RepID=UPI0023E2CD8A|nr:hypothetical protein [Klebsiella quasipneumoniae]